MVAMLFATLSIAIAIRVMFTIVLTQIVYVPNIGQHSSANVSDVLICPVKNSRVPVGNASSVTVDHVIAKNESFAFSMKLIIGFTSKYYFWFYFH